MVAPVLCVCNGVNRNHPELTADANSNRPKLPEPAVHAQYQ